MEREEWMRRFEENLQIAREWRERASAEFDAAIQALRDSRPDRGERLKSASKEYTLAMDAVNIALREYNDFVDFKKEPESETSPPPDVQPGAKAG